MTDDSFVMEMCGNRAAWQIEVDTVDKIDMEKVGSAIEAAGFTVEISTRLAWTFSGPADLTLYPSGKLLVKTEDRTLAEKIAKDHVKEWVRA